MGGDAFDTTIPLDVSELRRRGLPERLVSQLHRPWVYAVAQAVCPSFRLGGFVLVTRFDDVQDVLDNDQAFEVEGQRIARSNRGLGFLLGMADDPRCPYYQLRDSSRPWAQPPLSYRDYQDLVMKYFPLRDLPRVAAWSKSAAEAALHGEPDSAGALEIDAIQQLITHVPVELCRKYYGVKISDGPELARWTCAISRWLFDPAASSRFEKLGAAASDRLNALIDHSIAHQRRTQAQNDDDTVIYRMLQDGVDHAVVRAILFGMIMGFVPTNTMAGGHILQLLLDQPRFLASASSAARNNDDERLARCLFEAMRFKPLLRDPLRVCRQPYKLSDGWLPGVRCKPGERVIALVSSAVMDARRVREPARFDDQRATADGLLFGYGMHRCVGARLAQVQIAQTLKPLLRKRRLRVASGGRGKLKTLGPFPEHLMVQFDAE